MSRKKLKPRRPALNLERLEDRRCLAASIGLADDGHTLLIQGDRSDNQIAIVQDQHSVQVTADGGRTQAFTGIDKIVVDTGAGDDTVSYEAVTDIGSSDPPGELSVRLGAGNDTFSANLTDPPGPDHPVTTDPPGPDRIAVDAGAGDDVVTLRSAVDPNFHRLDLSANLGAGNDRFDANLTDPPGPDHPVTTDPPGPDRIAVSGEGGDDTIATLFSSLPTALSRASMPRGIDLQLDGGGGSDVVQNTMSNLKLNGRVNLDLNGGAGNDQVAQMFDRVFANAELDLNLNGGLGEDDLSLLALSRGSREMPFDPAFIANSQVSMRLEGGGGSDRFHADVTPCILPAGTLDLVLAGGRGNDLFDIELVMERDGKNTTEPYGTMSLTVLGGSGDDQLNLQVENLEDSISPLGIRLFGGGGRDTATVSPGINVEDWIGETAPR